MRRTKPRMLVFLLPFVVALLLIPTSAWACGKASFSPQTYVVDENDGRVFLTIVLHMDRPDTRTRKIAYQTVAGTAKNGTDFVGTSGSVAFSPGETSKTFAIDIVNDSTNEPVERFGVKMKTVPATSCVAWGPDAIVAIDDEDPAPKPPPREAAPVPPPKEDSSSSSSRNTATPEEPQLFEPPPPASPTPSPTVSQDAPNPRPADVTEVASGVGGGGGLSGFALAGIAIGSIAVGSLAVAGVRRRFLVIRPPN